MYGIQISGTISDNKGIKGNEFNNTMNACFRILQQWIE